MAGNAQGIRAGRAFVELYTKSDLLERGLSGGLSMLKNFAAQAAKYSAVAIGGTIAAVGAGFTAAIAHFTGHGDEIKKASDRLGIGAETLSGLAYAADQSGSSLEGLEKGIRKLQQIVFEASTGNEEAAETFDVLNLSVERLMAMKPDEMWLAVADSLSKVENVTARNALALKAFGKNGTEFIPLLLGGAKGVSALMDEASRIGVTVTQEQAESAEKVGDAFARVWSSIKGLFFQAGALLVPITDKIETISYFLTDVVKASSDWLKDTLSLDGAFQNLNQSWEAFSDAVSAGDVELAMTIAARTIEHEWSAMYDRLRDKFKSWQASTQTDLAKDMVDLGDSLEGSWFHWAFDNESYNDPSLRGPASKDVKKTLDTMEAEAQRNIVSPEEQRRRDSEAAKFQSDIDILREKAAGSKAAAEAERERKKEEARLKREAEKLNAGGGLAAMANAANVDPRKGLGLMGITGAAWGSFTGSSGSLRVPERAFEQETIKEQKKANELLEEIKKNTGDKKPLVLR